MLDALVVEAPNSKKCDELIYKPWLLLTRVTNRCDANCVYCMHEFVKPTPDMDFDLYKYLVDETVDYVRQVQPIGYGEPLLYPYIVEAVKYARDRGKRVTIYTNANALTPEMSKNLLKADLTDLRFSLEADTKEVFEFLRRPLKWETVYNNITEFLRIRDEGGYKCRTVIAGCTTKENRGTTARVVQFWKAKGINKRIFRREKIAPRPSDLEPKYTNYQRSRKTKFRQPARCKHLFDYLSVDWNGDVLPCCRDIYGTYVIGNVIGQDPLDVFNNDVMQDLRNRVETGTNYPTLCGAYCMKTSKRPLYAEKTYEIHEERNRLVRKYNEAYLHSLG